jgi:predicted metal-binding transcription factor (methanogenesis marker protein 9)
MANDKEGMCFGDCDCCYIKEPCKEYKDAIKTPNISIEKFALFKIHQAKIELWKGLVK